MKETQGSIQGFIDPVRMKIKIKKRKKKLISNSKNVGIYIRGIRAFEG